MDDGLKQRLIGAIVLLALVVIFVPSLFNSDARRRVDLTSQIPPEPIDSPMPLEVPDPERPEGIDQAPPLEQYYPHREEASEPLELDIGEPSQATTTEPTQSGGSTEVSSEASSVLDEQGIPRAWSIQVGSFQSQERAEALHRQLLDGDYAAYVRSAQLDGQTTYRVFVGPKINRDQALAEKAELERLPQIDRALLVQYKP